MLSGWLDALLETAALSPTDCVLDVGCGCGATTLAVAREVSDGHALGVDISKGMIACARERADAAGITNVRFAIDDAQVRQFEPTFDTVISRFGVVFFADPAAAFSNFRRALKPGGKLVFVTWKSLAENPWMKLTYDAATAYMPA